MDRTHTRAQLEWHKRRRFGFYLAVAVALYIGMVISFIIAY
jgi:hypothetical protein